MSGDGDGAHSCESGFNQPASRRSRWDARPAGRRPVSQQLPFSNAADCGERPDRGQQLLERVGHNSPGVTPRYLRICVICAVTARRPLAAGGDWTLTRAGGMALGQPLLASGGAVEYRFNPLPTWPVPPPGWMPPPGWHPDPRWPPPPPGWRLWLPQGSEPEARTAEMGLSHTERASVRWPIPGSGSCNERIRRSD